MIELLRRPWPWYIAGPLIGLIVPALLISGNKSFGISSSFRHICAACLPAKIPFFNYNWKKEAWNLFFVAGILIGAFITVAVFSDHEPVKLNPATIATLKRLGVQDFNGLLPADIFNWQNLFTLQGAIFCVGGGFLVGFGTRYAGGCTSGHSILGVSSFQLSSIIATICFMIGGFITTYFILPGLLSL